MKKIVTIMNTKGIHARTAAMIASYVYGLKKEFDFKMNVVAENDEKIPIVNVIPLASLSIKKDDMITLEATGKDAQKAIDLVSAYITGDIDNKQFSIDEIDSALEASALKINTELKSLKNLKNRLSSILDNISDGICLMDSNGIIMYVNKSYARIFDVEKDTLIGKDAKILFSKRPSVEALKNKNKKVGVVFKEEELKVVSNSMPIYAEGEFQGIITSYSVVDELKEIMNQLDLAEEKIMYYQKELNKKNNVHEAFNIIIGESSTLKEALAISTKAAKTSATVVIRGESGTGKELVSKAIHIASKRLNGPFIKINCAAIPENLLESELFGHEKGAFTGAIARKIGKFELADKGTIFLDEIGELSLSLQVKLLRVIQERELQRIGGNDVVKVDIRIIAATNRNLEELVKEGKFREDLYYRLNVIQIFLPPLRERHGDIPLLCEYFIDQISKREETKPKILTREVLNYFQNYDWPGNIRELENILIRGMTMSEGEFIDINCLPRHITLMEKNKTGSIINVFGGELETMEAYDKEIIRLALNKYGSFNKTAKALGLTHRTVSLKAKKYGLI